jgi:hypothetical protein
MSIRSALIQFLKTLINLISTRINDFYLLYVEVNCFFSLSSVLSPYSTAPRQKSKICIH